MKKYNILGRDVDASLAAACIAKLIPVEELVEILTAEAAKRISSIIDFNVHGLDALPSARVAVGELREIFEALDALDARP